MPSIINTLIQSLLSPTICSEPVTENDKEFLKLSGHNMCIIYDVSTILILFVAVSVPIMLCTKPCIAYFHDLGKSQVSETQMQVLQ